MIPANEQPVFAYVVTAYRWGQRNAHSYVVGAFPDLEAAKKCATEHIEYRGGKYGCEVTAAGQWSETSDLSGKQVFYVESPYHGMAGDAGHYHCADVNKRSAPSRKPFTVRELQNEISDLERQLDDTKKTALWNIRMNGPALFVTSGEKETEYIERFRFDELQTVLNAWFEAFKTTQLSHALAVIEVAETAARVARSERDQLVRQNSEMTGEWATLMADVHDYFKDERCDRGHGRVRLVLTLLGQLRCQRDDEKRQNAILLDALKKCDHDRAELISGVCQAIVMVGAHYDEFCDEEVPEMTSGSPMHRSLTSLRAHLEGTTIGDTGEHMEKDKFTALTNTGAAQ